MAVKMLMKGAILPGNSTVEIKDFEIPKTAKYGSVRKNAVAAIPVSMSVPLAAVPGSA